MPTVTRYVTALNTWQKALAQLGECIAEFQYLEDSLGIAITALAGVRKPVGAILTSEMSFRAKLAVYRSLFTHHFRGSRPPEDLSDLMKRLHWAEQERNALLHSLWDPSVQRPRTVRRTKAACRRDGFSKVRVSYTPEDLEEISATFEGIAKDVFFVISLHIPKAAARFEPRPKRSKKVGAGGA